VFSLTNLVDLLYNFILVLVDTVYGFGYGTVVLLYGLSRDIMLVISYILLFRHSA